ncbi:hypothetical protein F1737_02640 [Methanoplanus sp. FWC-SCC4]|uniref:Uncharacterized protein n=1 Tax=Methanochimaera problematica TaxID=2609417 RepID=A0AA97I1Y0_9EURY|nr:hypothetical protein [Methanoplanus sp. FWC-SCC4]WOF15660.1 hypothetical protein F1737_02640 [Methanoplanus sp. FWC-SCC4]
MVAGNKFPKITAETLLGNEITLPDDTAGKVTVIFIAFVRSAQSMIDSWMIPFEKEFPADKSIVVYEIPVIDSPLWRPFKSVIDGGMRSGISPDKHDSIITYCKDASLITGELGIKDRSLAYIYILDQNGVIIWENKGYADLAGLSEMKNILRSIKSG